MFAFDMLTNTTSVEGIKSFLQQPRFQRRLSLEQSVNFYLGALKEYPEGDPAGLLREMGTEAYLKLSDDEVNYYDG